MCVELSAAEQLAHGHRTTCVSPFAEQPVENMIAPGIWQTCAAELNRALAQSTYEEPLENDLHKAACAEVRHADSQSTRQEPRATCAVNLRSLRRAICIQLHLAARLCEATCAEPRFVAHDVERSHLWSVPGCKRMAMLVWRSSTRQRTTTCLPE